MHFRSRKKSAGDVLLSDVIETDKEGNSISLMDMICQEDDTLENLSTSDTYEQLNRYIDDKLTPREAKIIRMRYGIGGRKPLTQRDVAEECGISRSYVSRIEKKALEKLRASFEEDDGI